MYICICVDMHIYYPCICINVFVYKQNHIYNTSRTRARRVAEVSSFKKCNAIGSKDKVCLSELRKTSTLFSLTSDLLSQIVKPLVNSSNDFSPLVISFQRPSFLCTSS